MKLGEFLGLFVPNGRRLGPVVPVLDVLCGFDPDLEVVIGTQGGGTLERLDLEKFGVVLNNAAVVEVVEWRRTDAAEPELCPVAFAAEFGGPVFYERVVSEPFKVVVVGIIGRFDLDELGEDDCSPLPSWVSGDGRGGPVSG